MTLKKLLNIVALFTLSCGGTSNDSQKDTIQGLVAGLEGTIVIQLNGSEKFSIKEDGEFNFKTSLESNSDYTIRVIDEPCAQRCTLDSDSGKVPSDQIIRLNVACDAKEWEKPLELSDSISFPTTDVQELSIALNDYGDAVLAWTQQVNSFYGRIYKKEFKNRVWQSSIDKTDYMNVGQEIASNISTTLNKNGESYVSWNEKNKNGVGGIAQLYVAQKLNDIWVFPELNIPISNEGIETYPTTYHGSTYFKVNNNGIGFAAWWQGGDSVYKMYYSNLKNNVWSNPAILNNVVSNIYPDRYDIDINEKGDVVIAWPVYVGSTWRLYVARRIDNVWVENGTLVSPIDTVDAYIFSTSVAMDELGDVSVAWSQLIPKYSQAMVYRADYKPKSGWTKPINSEDYLNSYVGTGSWYPSITMNNDGRSVLTWKADSKDGGIQLNKMIGYRGDWNTNIETVSLNGEVQYTTARIDDQNNGVIFWMDGPIDTLDYRLFVAQSHDVTTNKWNFPASLSDHISIGSSRIGDFVVDMKNCRIASAWTQLDASEKYYALYVAMYR